MTVIHLISLILFINLQTIINASFINPFKKNVQRNLNIDNENQKNYNVPIIIFGGMGASCRSRKYKNLIKQLGKNFNPDNIKCYKNKIFSSMLE